jgi:hypothetical protein
MSHERAEIEEYPYFGGKIRNLIDFEEYNPDL